MHLSNNNDGVYNNDGEKSITAELQPVPPSKRKDGLSLAQAGSIFAQTNAFFTLKWPHVIALLLSTTAETKAMEIKLDPVAQDKNNHIKAIIQAKFKELLGLKGVK